MIRTDDLIIVFTRNPELGKVKTRLASSIGPASALNIYNYLLSAAENIPAEEKEKFESDLRDLLLEHWNRQSRIR